MYSNADLLVVPTPPFPLHATEARKAHFDLDYRITGAPATGTESLSFCGAIYSADDFGVAHFEIRGAICGGLSGDLGCEAAEFVPAATIEAEKSESIGGCIEGHSQESVMRARISVVL